MQKLFNWKTLTFIVIAVLLGKIMGNYFGRSEAMREIKEQKTIEASPTQEPDKTEEIYSTIYDECTKYEKEIVCKCVEQYFRSTKVSAEEIPVDEKGISNYLAEHFATAVNICK